MGLVVRGIVPIKNKNRNLIGSIECVSSYKNLLKELKQTKQDEFALEKVKPEIIKSAELISNIVLAGKEQQS